MTGVLVGVGVGPGDPEHVTLKALRELRAADRLFVPATGSGVNRAEQVVAEHVPGERIQRIPFAMRDAGERDRSWDRAGEVVVEILRVGGTAAFATLGDPNLYSTFAYLAHTVRALHPSAEIRTVPGITAMQDLAARTGTVLAEGTEPVALLPFTAGEGALEDALRRGDTVVVYKGGRRLPLVLEAVERAGRLPHAVYGERLGADGGRCMPAAEHEGPGPYFSTVIVPAPRTGRRGEKL